MIKHAHSRATRPPRVGYLVSQYPAINHTFVLREIVELRRSGMMISTVSLAHPDRDVSALSEIEHQEMLLTTYAAPNALSQVLLANARCALKNPWRYVKVMLKSFSIGISRGEPRLKGLIRFAQAATAAVAFHDAGVTHVHAHFTSTVARLTSQLSGLPWSVTIHGPAEFDDVVATRLAEKVREASFTVAISHFGASQLFRLLDQKDWCRIEVCPLGVDPERFEPNRTPTGQSGESRPFTVACVARLAPVKGLGVLIDAIRHVRDAGVPIQLRLVGDGVQRDELCAMVHERGLESQVHFEGWRTESQVREILAGADAFVMTSFAEGIPVVLMEAMAMELPCVATWVNGVPELISHERNGLLVPAGDAAATGNALLRLYRDSDFATQLGKAGRKTVCADFDLARNVRVLAAALQRRIAEPAAIVAPPRRSAVADMPQSTVAASVLQRH